MKKVIILTVALILVIAGIAMATVVGSKHDMTRADIANGHISDGVTSGRTNQVCVFCHHPHMTGVTAANANALWNRTDTGTKTYLTYGSATMNASAGSGDALGTARYSRMCLSCHDSGIALTVVTKSPGAFIGGAYISNSLASGNQANIAGDTGSLENDHPIDFDYSLSDDEVGIKAQASDSSVIGNMSSYNYPLYSGAMQCPTCHDVHDNTLSAGIQFMRGGSTSDLLASSTMCRDCHTNK